MVAQLYTGRKSAKQGDCLEDMTLPHSEKCATYLDFGKTVLDRVPYTLARDSNAKIKSLLVILHPGVKTDAEPVSRAQLDRIAKGAVKSFENSCYQVAFMIDETPIQLG